LFAATVAGVAGTLLREQHHSADASLPTGQANSARRQQCLHVFFS